MASLTTVNLNQLITDQRDTFECILLHSFTYSAEPFNYTILYKKKIQYVSFKSWYLEESY